jgi:hypothetical protein
MDNGVPSAFSNVPSNLPLTRLKACILPVAEITNQQAMAKCAKVTECESYAPRGIQSRSVLQAQQEASVEVENVNVAQPVTMIFILLTRGAMAEVTIMLPLRPECQRRVISRKV